jgi:RHS repeat-associated protein
LSNHLGNVLTVISDKKTAVFTGTSFNYFAAERISATDYSPFGAPLESRTWQASEYRFGFNAQERDDEIAGAGNIMTAQFWEYDTRLGRRWNLDPKPYFGLSEYACLGDNPILFNDPFGDIFKITKTQDGKLNEKAKDDVKSLAVNQDNAKYIKFDEKDGTVSLDFGKDMTQKEREKIINGDIGIKLISDLIGAKKVENGVVKDALIVYDVSDEVVGIDRETNKKQVVKSWVANLSITPKFQNSGIEIPKGALTDPKPINSDGFVKIRQGRIKTSDNRNYLKRASLVYHELRENYYRTAIGLPYAFSTDDYTYGKDGKISGTGAHVRSAFDEGNSYGNSMPGAAGDFE